MNSLLKLPKDQMAALRFEDVRAYLISHGWRLDKDASAEGMGLFRLPDESDAEILLPLQRDWNDYAERMAEAVATLAAVEERAIGQVINDLSGPEADVLRFRIIAPNTTLGTLPLNDGLRLLQGSRDLLLAAACSAHQHQAYYPRQTFNEALEFLHGCRLGQTERGSYVATLIAPVPAELPSLPFPDDLKEEEWMAAEPYPRRVMLQLASGLRFVRRAIQAGKPADILQGVPAGVSANLCEALAVMAPSSEQATLEIRTTWSRSRLRVPSSLPQNVAFTQGEFALINEVGRRLREGLAPRRQQVEGVIVSLQADADLFEDFQGKVVLRAEVGGRSVRVKFALKQPDYSRACDAHRDQKRVVVSGMLQRKAHSKMYDLFQPRDFAIRSDPI